MIKIVVSAVWICLVTIGSSYAAAMWAAGQQQQTAPVEEFFGGLDYVKSNTISVPIISGGAITGYVVAQFVFTVDGKILRKLSVPPELFLIDEAFRAIYAGEAPDFADLEKYDLSGLKQKIAANINERFGTRIVRDVLIEQFNYVPKEAVRYGPKR